MQNIINGYVSVIKALEKENAELNLRLNYFSGSLQIKVCTGCNWRSDKKFDSKTAIACCPDSNYIGLDEYLKNSVYKKL